MKERVVNLLHPGIKIDTPGAPPSAVARFVTALSACAVSSPALFLFFSGKTIGSADFLHI